MSCPPDPLPDGIGGLFYGYGGLDMAAAAVFGGELKWYAEVDGLPTQKRPTLSGACAIAAHHHPHVPNLGDVTKIDWHTVPRVRVLTGGSPCQDLSGAGPRGGMRAGTRSNLWVAMREGIATLRPPIVIWENVRGAASAEADSNLEHQPGLLASVRRRPGQPVLRALGRVVGDLADLGYDTRWVGLPAAAVGAPHPRFRFFLLAHPRGTDPAALAVSR